MQSHWLLPLLLCSAAAQLDRGALAERVAERDVLLDVRVLDHRNEPVTGLTADDFQVTIAGRAAVIRSVHWAGASTDSPTDGTRSNIATRGRLVVVLIQKNLVNSPVTPQARQIVALQKTLQVADPLLSALTAADRVAVLSLDSELHLRCDFTDQFDRVRELLQTDILTTDTGCERSPSAPSFAEALTPERLSSVRTVEHAFTQIATALSPIAGSKLLVFLGYGFGTPDALNRSLYTAAQLPGIATGAEYDKARAALVAARTSVFSIDVTDAQRHSLETGLETIAEDTGGVFVRAYQFPDIALGQVAKAMLGHYVIALETPDVGRGEKRVNVRLSRGSGRVSAPKTYLISYGK